MSAHLWELGEKKNISMEVIKVSPRGYCYGVVDALQVVQKAVKDTRAPRPIHIPGQIIHNPHAVETLITLDGPDRVDLLELVTGGTVIFTAHGVSPLTKTVPESNFLEEVLGHELLLLDDIAEMLWHLILPSSLYRYCHDDFSVRTINMTEGESKNGHAHCPHLFIGASCHLSVIEGSLELGQWLRIFLVKLDRTRTKAGCHTGEWSSRTFLRWRIGEKQKEKREYGRSGIDHVSVHSLCGTDSKRAPERDHAAEEAFLFSGESCA